MKADSHNYKGFFFYRLKQYIILCLVCEIYFSINGKVCINNVFLQAVMINMLFQKHFLKYLLLAVEF